MLFLLRKIRRKLMQKNKFTTYLLYAIGEIFLVVIGILIAVSINNWNQDRKDRLVELKYLTNLKADLVQELRNNDTFLAFRRAKVKSSSIALHMDPPSSIEDVKTYTDHYEQVFFWNVFVPNNNTFKELLSSGNLNQITSDSIKQGLLELDNQYASIANVEHHMRREFEEYLYDVMINNASGLEFYDTKAVGDSLIYLKIEDIPISKHKELIADAQWLHRDQTFNNGLKLAFMNNTGLVQIHMELEAHLNLLIDLIDKEIVK